MQLSLEDMLPLHLRYKAGLFAFSGYVIQELQVNEFLLYFPRMKKEKAMNQKQKQNQSKRLQIVG